MTSTPLTDQELAGIEAVVRNAPLVGADIDPGTAAALLAEVRRLRAAEPDPEAIHCHFGLTYANYLVLPRTLLQSMDDKWQTRFVALLRRFNEAFTHVPQADGYKVDAAVEREISDLDEDEQKQFGVTEDWYRGETPPEGLDEAGLREWEAEHEDPEGPVYYRDGQEVDGDEIVLIPVPDPVPHYNRGRAYIQPQLGLPDTWVSPKTRVPFDLHADYPVTRAQYDVLLKGEDHSYQGLVWRHFGEFVDGVPVLLAVSADGASDQRVEGSIKVSDYEAAGPSGAGPM